MNSEEPKSGTQAEAEEAQGKAGAIDGEGEAPGLVVPSRRSRRQGEAASGKRGLLIVIPLVTAAAAIAGLVLTGMKDNAIYSKPVDELIANRSKFAGRPVRADGTLVHGTLVKREQPCEYRFTIEKNGVRVPVRYAQCVVPDTFRDVPGMDVAVTVEGQLQPDDSFEATTVLAKCPSKYEMRDRAEKGEAMPHAAMGSEGASASSPPIVPPASP
jgi:cytochrome c-type biogenesis protein CcmE